MKTEPMENSCETVPPPTAQVAVAELWKRYHQDRTSAEAEEALIHQYLPWVKTVVGRVAMTLPPHVEMEDLYSAGLVGLLNAVRNFNPNANASFETYARLRIRGAVLDELRKMDWIPRSVHAKARKIQTAIQELEQKLGRLPTETEIARALGLSAREYEHWLDEVRPAAFVSLDSAGVLDDDSPPPYESVADSQQETPAQKASRRELAAMIAERLEQLPEMQRKVLALYYFEDMRLREIAEVFGLTESRICQIHAQAIMAIKAYLMKRDVMPE
jgi:RNA polymerase sigma factor for flagellar operon FliA